MASTRESRAGGRLRLAAVVALVSVGIGPLVAHLGLVEPIVGFGVFAAGLLMGVALLVVGSVLFLRGRRQAWPLIATGFGALAVGVVSGLPGRGVPRINDVATDPHDPPAFAAAAALSENRARDLSYPPGNARLQGDGYPDLAPLELAEPPEEAVRRAAAVARELGWSVLDTDDPMTLEANDVSLVFRFVDDVVVRVRPTPQGSRVDVRSKSRDGKGDLGVNARRIRRFLAAMRR